VSNVERTAPSDGPMLTDAKAFGARLIATRDLDPVYVGLAGAKLPEPQMCRLLTAYWCFYHLGAAAWLSECEGESYWREMMRAALNVEPSPLGLRWPRAAERRHFRGRKCVDAIAWFARSNPEYYVHLAMDVARVVGTLGAVMKCVESWPMHGPWIAFKAADMLERIMGARITFDWDIGYVYREPRMALDLIAACEGTSPLIV
jgi:hypothetical protein